MKKTIFLSIVFIVLGFLIAFSIFKFLTTEKPEVIPIPSLTASQQASVNKPITGVSQPSKDFKQSSTTNVNIATQSNVPVVLQDKKQDITNQNQEVAKKELPTLVLNGVFTSKSGSYALINNRIVKEGDLILGARLERIYSNVVELDYDGEKITLRVK